jgi:hypothetical protein
MNDNISNLDYSSDDLWELIDELSEASSEHEVDQLLNRVRDLVMTDYDVNEDYPIFAAINLTGNLTLVQILVEAGADVNIVEPDDFNTPLFAAKSLGYTEIAEYLEPLTNDEIRRITAELLEKKDG